MCLGPACMSLCCTRHVAGARAQVDTTLPSNGKLIQVLSPSGNEICTVGDTIHIRWHSVDSIIACVHVSISADSGRTWLDLNQGYTICLGSRKWECYGWVVTDSLDDMSGLPVRCFVKVSSFMNWDISDTSSVIIAPRACAANTGDPRVAVTASRDELRSFLEAADAGPGAKLVFTTFPNSQVYYVDFSETAADAPAIRVLENAAEAAAPVISPDGEWVAYAKGVQGNCGHESESETWVCRLSQTAVPFMLADPGFVPRFVLNATNPTVIYSTCRGGDDNFRYAWDGCGKVIKREIIAGVAGPEEIVYDGGSYYGGLSSDGRYLATAPCATKDAFMLDLTAGTNTPDSLHNLRVKKKTTDEDTTVGIEPGYGCVSSSRIFTNAMMYLDFGSGTLASRHCYHPVMGMWQFCERLFITRNDREILRIYDAPEKETILTEAELDTLSNNPSETQGQRYKRQWDAPQWSNHPYFALAPLMRDRVWYVNGMFEHRMAAEALYLVNLRDSTYLKVVETTDSSFASTTNMRLCAAWIEMPEEFSEDSLWLEYPYGTSVHIPGSGGDRDPQVGTRRLRTAKNLGSISVYAVDGRLVHRADLSGAAPFRPRSRGIGPGLRVVVTRSVDGRIDVYRYMTTRN